MEYNHPLPPTANKLQLIAFSLYIHGNWRLSISLENTYW